jgi:2-polyprenyl-3-methyl-5-hydroxy-6-metoxy-1,4-benzoquinol methylase
MTEHAYSYKGGELDAFGHATNWKRYWTAAVRDRVQGDVLEVGAGIGSNTILLRGSRHTRWVCLEPDPRLARRIVETLGAQRVGTPCEVVAGTVGGLASGERFDTILYIDVLEHIEDDRGELASADLHLNPGGRLIVLAPAYSWLYSPFDRSLGHFRRYDANRFRAILPAGLVAETLIHLDSVGVLVLLMNRFMARVSCPSALQVRLWDQVAVPVSRALDAALLRSAGKSVLGVWRKARATGEGQC